MTNEKYGAVLDFAYVVLGTILYALSVNVFYDPNEIVLGGVSGVSIIIRNIAFNKFAADIPMWLLNIGFNVPLIIIGYIFLGKRFISKTIIGVLLVTFFLRVTQNIPSFKGDTLLTVVYGGIICGVGLGFVFRAMGSTGGADIIAAVAHKLFEYISISKALFALDVLVIGTSFFIFGAEKCMYSIISVFISSKLIDAILEGTSFSKAAYIISDKYEEIAEAILKEKDRGVTALYGRGMYTNTEKQVLLCVFGNKELPAIKKIVGNIDKNAFILLTDAKEVLGEGFNRLKND